MSHITLVIGNYVGTVSQTTAIPLYFGHILAIDIPQYSTVSSLDETLFHYYAQNACIFTAKFL